MAGGGRDPRTVTDRGHAEPADRALLAQIRPVLVTSKITDAPEKVGFMDGHWVKVEGGRAVAEATDDAVYLAISVRNAGNGMAVLDRWDFTVGRQPGTSHHRDIEHFRRLTRDLYVPAGEVGFWQGTFRDRDDRCSPRRRPRSPRAR